MVPAWDRFLHVLSEDVCQLVRHSLVNPMAKSDVTSCSSRLGTVTRVFWGRDYTNNCTARVCKRWRFGHALFRTFDPGGKLKRPNFFGKEDAIKAAAVLLVRIFRMSVKYI